MFGDETGGIVVDYGTHTSKFGFAGEDCPRLVVTTKHPFAEQYNLGIQQFFPTSRTSGEEEEETLTNNEIADHPIMCITPAQVSLKQQVEFAETLLENGQTPAVYLLRAPVAATFASGKTNALVLDLGASAATCSPVFQGFTLIKPTMRNEAFGGNALTNVLLTSNTKNSTFALAEEWKRHVRFDSSSAAETAHTLPDGTAVEYASLKQTLFPFNAADADTPGLTDLVYDSLAMCDPDLRKQFAGEILVVGGGALFRGLGDTLQRELGEKLNPYFKPKVHTTGTTIERHFAPFVGGSILACLGSFQQEWASRKELQELGVEKLCLERFMH